MTPVAILFCDPRGVYASPALTRGGGAIPWGLPARDARSYSGPHPVVAHPPCERWGAYATGGPSSPRRLTPGDDGGCFASALAAARAWVAWCEAALAVRVAAGHTATLRGASPDARAALASARETAAALLCAHAAATVTDDPADAARARSWTRTVGALVALAAGEGPYAPDTELQP